MYFSRLRAIVLVLLLPLMLHAGNVSESAALQKARAFLAERGMAAPVAMRLAMKGHKAQQATQSDYYVFNVGQQQGFVIVSGDDRVDDILGYADSGMLQEDGLPDGLRYLLDGYAEQLAWLDSHPEQAVSHRAPARSSIAPMVETRWDQGAPYYNNCPEYNEERTVTGCVATSMAQVMYYHKKPTAACSAIPGYTTRTLGIALSGLPATTFDWNKLKTTYSSGDTSESAVEVAKLMQYCGTTLQMNYNVAKVGGSSAYNVSIAEALKTYFGYDGSVTYCQRQHYSYGDWVEMVYGELAQNRPVVLGGQSAGGGHSFVCDGYDTGDYFHINWGWSGSSDGYFRLSLLNPWEQGIGGSSTMDGFSFTQDAVIGIKPCAGVSANSYLSLECFQLDVAGTKMSQSYNRASSGDAFTGISLYFAVCSYLFGTNSFDYAVQLCTTSGEVLRTMSEVNNQDMTFNTDLTVTVSDLSTSTPLADGTYIIKVVSRAHGASSWQECYDGAMQQLTATVSGNTLTISAPFVNGYAPTYNSMTVTGVEAGTDCLVGYEQEVMVTVTGGATDYHGNLLLKLGGKTLMGKTVDVPAGVAVDVRFSYTPSTAGTNTLEVWTKTTKIGEKSVTILSSDASNEQTITVTPVTIHNLSDGKLYGNKVSITACVNNDPLADKRFVSTLNCSLRKYNSSSDDVNNYISATVLHQHISIPESGSINVPFEWVGVEPGKFYRLRFTYAQGDGKGGTTVTEALLTGCYEMGEGYLRYESDGSTTAYQMASTLDGDTALCMDLTAISNFNGKTITTSGNPNCVYLLKEGVETPSALDDCNVVKGTTAAKLALTDGYDFFTPVSFTATTATYTRTFILPAAGASGWNALMVPFTVSSVTCEGLGTVDWFHSGSDTGKNFWLRTFTGDAVGSVNFDYADELTANTPYLIAVPGDTWGAAWQMTGKAVTFHGSGVGIATTSEGSLSGNYYQFVGSNKGTTVKDVYVLNAAGSSFVKKTVDTAVDAFRAWIAPIDISSLTLPSLTITSGQPTGIDSVKSGKRKVESWYTLDGRVLQQRPQTKGIYICQGKKIIIK